jgi:iron complex outermembrane receptor protein
MSYTDYKHDETEGGAVEATFKNKGWEAHIGGTHIPVGTALGQLKGAWGIQASESRLRMTSGHPLLPNSNTNTKAFFVFEELAFAKDKAVNFGARIEDVRVSALAGNGSESDESGAKKFKPFSSSLGYRQNLNKVWTATSNLSYTERAPTFYELFADGEHHATGSYEVGNVNQKKEKGRTLDVALNYKTESSRARLGAFVSDFSNFIGLQSEGYLREDTNHDWVSCDPVNRSDCISKYAFTGIKARLYGLEADGRFPIARGVMQQASQIDLAWKADYVRGEDRTNGTPLPRISPLRLSAAFIYTQGRYSSQFDVRHAASQNRYADGLGSTPSYTLLGMGASYRTKMPGLNSAYWFVRVDNLTNEVARNASSVMRDVTMAGSRAVRVGLRANF